MTFHGFGPQAGDFFARLQEDNTKAFFDANRDIYVREIRQPIESLLAEAEATYGAGRVMRPNRDVRFSAKKEPYNTNASMWAGTVGGVYLSLTMTGLEVGGGLYSPTRDQLERARAAIATQPSAASELSTIVAKLAERGFAMAGPSLKTAPRGYDKEHPHIALLRLKHFAALVTLPIAAEHSAILDSWKQVEPLIGWAERFVGPALSWP